MVGGKNMFAAAQIWNHRRGQIQSWWWTNTKSGCAQIRYRDWDKSDIKGFGQLLSRGRCWLCCNAACVNSRGGEAVNPGENGNDPGENHEKENDPSENVICENVPLVKCKWEISEIVKMSIWVRSIGTRVEELPVIKVGQLKTCQNQIKWKLKVTGPRVIIKALDDDDVRADSFKSFKVAEEYLKFWTARIPPWPNIILLAILSKRATIIISAALRHQLHHHHQGNDDDDG